MIQSLFHGLLFTVFQIGAVGSGPTRVVLTDMSHATSLLVRCYIQSRLMMWPGPLTCRRECATGTAFS